MSIRLIAFLAVITVLRLVYIGRVDLSPDEAQYFEWSQRLDWCYFSKGPGVALAIKLGTSLFGPNEFGVRFLAPILALGTSLILYALARRIYEARAAAWAVVIANATPLFNAGGLIMTIDPLSIFFWTAALYTLWRAFEARQDAEATSERGVMAGLGWWVLSGALIGCGFLCKWTNAFQLLSVVLLVLLTKRFRPVLRSAGFWAMLGVFLLFVVPVAIWNDARGWPTTTHLAARGGLSSAGEEAGPDASQGAGNTLQQGWTYLRYKLPGIVVAKGKSFSRFFFSHFGVYSPLIFAGMLVVLWQASKDSMERWARGLVTCWQAIPGGLRRHPWGVALVLLLALTAYFTGNYNDDAFIRSLAWWILVLGALVALARHKESGNIHWRSRFLVAFALPLVIVYAWISLNHDAEVNWTAPASVSLVILLAQMADRLWNADRRRLVTASVGLGALMSIIIVNTDWVRAVGIPWRFDRDPTARLRGWETTAVEVHKVRQHIEQQLGRPVFLIGENYGVAAELCFYLPEKRIEAPGHPAVYVEESPVPTSQFHFWGRYDEFEERTAPVVNDQEDTSEYGVNRFAGRAALYITTRNERKPPSVLLRTFERWELAREFRVDENGMPLRNVRVFICHRYKPGLLLD